MDTIFKRVSIRKYTDAGVEQEKVEKLLRAAMAAPSAGNQQPWEFIVVRDRAKLNELAGMSPYSKNCERAPLAIVPCVLRDGWAPIMADQDVAAATENLLLEATELGLGAVWQGIPPHEQARAKVRAMLDIPGNIDPFCVIAIGYPAEQREQQDRYKPEKVRYID